MVSSMTATERTRGRSTRRRSSTSSKLRELLQERMLFEEFSGNSVKEILAKVKAALASTLEEMGVDGVISTPKSDSEFYDSLAITIPVVVKSRVRVWVKLLFSRSIYDETEDWRDRGGNWRAIVSEIK